MVWRGRPPPACADCGASHVCVRPRGRGQDALGTAGGTPALQNL